MLLLEFDGAGNQKMLSEKQSIQTSWKVRF